MLVCENVVKIEAGKMKNLCFCYHNPNDPFPRALSIILLGILW